MNLYEKRIVFFDIFGYFFLIICIAIYNIFYKILFFKLFVNNIYYNRYLSMCVSVSLSRPIVSTVKKF